MKIAFIGLGNMGSGMASNLVKAAHEVHIYDINPEIIRHLNNKGFVIHQNLDTAVKDTDAVVTMLPEGKHVKEVYLSENGVINNVKENTILIDCSTIDIESIKEVGKEANINRLSIIDAPVSGGIVGAIKGNLTFMVGGTNDSFNLSLPILKNMGHKVIHAGELGAGQAAKICNNMILGISMIALGESFTMAKRLGLDQKKLFEISSKASGMSWAMLNHLPVAGIIETAAANVNFKPGFSASMMVKDLSLAQSAAKSVNLNTPIGSLALKMYKEFVGNGRGNLDYSAIIKMIDNSV